jgi:protein SCO1/2
MKGLKWLVFVFVLLIPVAYYFVQPKEKSLPIINPVDVNDSLVDPELLRLGYGHTIQPFKFLNQDSVLVTDADFDEKIWVAEYFFTTCGSICPIMTQQMMRVQERFKTDGELQILSFTVYPEVDQPAQLKRYAKAHKAELPQWQFLTGKKEDLYSLARKSFFLLKPAEAKNLGDAGSDFIHTNNFVLIDKQKRIRGYYDGTDSLSVDELMIDIEILKKE